MNSIKPGSSESVEEKKGCSGQLNGTQQIKALDLCRLDLKFERLVSYM